MSEMTHNLCSEVDGCQHCHCHECHMEAIRQRDEAREKLANAAEGRDTALLEWENALNEAIKRRGQAIRCRKAEEASELLRVERDEARSERDHFRHRVNELLSELERRDHFDTKGHE